MREDRKGISGEGGKNPRLGQKALLREKRIHRLEKISGGIQK